MEFGIWLAVLIIEVFTILSYFKLKRICRILEEEL